MKVFVYSYRDFDEEIFFQKYAKEYGIELGISREAPTLENAHLAEGYPYISIITTPIDGALIDKFYELGVKMISTRTIGYDHVNIKRAKEVGMHISNVTYSPHGVADYTIMLMLMAIRKMKRIMERAMINDFSLKGIQGRELSQFTVGILGTGKIGTKVLQYLSGFGCKLYAYDAYPNDEAKKYADYVDLETLYKECDLLSLHMDLNKDNYHLINKESLAKMKDQVVIINTARGALIDSTALIEALENGKIGAVGLDVIENEFNLYYYDLKDNRVENRELFILRGFPNVVVTPHMAFYTDQAISDMVLHSLQSCYYMEQGKENPWQVV
ncbi:lactate dehydrogenase [Sporanaerobium hydrogeniformans]|uniref:Lactate dehydrogenase n=1 Tax=Sporanaerobium hydrogeniformans TaxID=3072179 RepID=A0AC61DF06_9FIRM|nr:D-isomer specific 2-hydroxyacid dehydrogenase family protein [Sporanaerobium hydrogeniformans]PHV71408.1 lactate dehydrogenase [Sporanaerobium hydrogeniformans]